MSLAPWKRVESPFVGLQKFDPVGDVPAPDVPVEAKFRAQEGGAQLGNLS